MSNHSLKDVRWGIIPITIYKGCLVYKVKNGYKIFGRIVGTPEQVDKIIDEANISIQKSLK